MISVSFYDTELRKINIFGQYLQFTKLSNIINARGTEININYLTDRQHDSTPQLSKVPRPPEITCKSCKLEIIKQINK